MPNARTAICRLLVALSLGFSAGLSLAQAPAAAVSAGAANAAMVRGAAVVDIRSASDYAAGHLPGAVSAPGLADASDLASLQHLVSAHGIDLSREVLLVGQPGDERAMRLQSRLNQYATGRIAWLVGGVHEWVLSGRPVATGAVTLPPVPQYLVDLQPQAPAPRMAGANLRDVGMRNRPALASAL
ncbi:MAG: rhodanese-like domain-containing protein [Pseudomonadota bacterium]